MTEYFEDQINFYFLLDNIENGSLSSLVNARKGSIDFSFIRRSFLQIIHTLSKIHKKNIIHRDLKPDNILFDKDNNVGIIDFGSAFEYEKIDDNGFVECKVRVLGSIDFTTPEVLNKAESISPALDLWDYGCCLFFAMTGKAPFFSPNRLETFDNIKNCKYSLEEVKDKDAAGLIGKLLNVDPEKRIGFNEHESGYPSICNHPFFNCVI